jgi:hypothetical protein
MDWFCLQVLLITVGLVLDVAGVILLSPRTSTRHGSGAGGNNNAQLVRQDEPSKRLSPASLAGPDGSMRRLAPCPAAFPSAAASRVGQGLRQPRPTRRRSPTSWPKRNGRKGVSTASKAPSGRNANSALPRSGTSSGRSPVLSTSRSRRRGGVLSSSVESAWLWWSRGLLYSPWRTRLAAESGAYQTVSTGSITASLSDGLDRLDQASSHPGVQAPVDRR